MPAPRDNAPTPLRPIQTIGCVKPVEYEALSILEGFWQNIFSEISGSIILGNGRSRHLPCQLNAKIHIVPC